MVYLFLAMERDGTEYLGYGAFFLLATKTISLFMAKQAVSNQLKELSVAVLQEKIGKMITCLLSGMDNQGGYLN